MSEKYKTVDTEKGYFVTFTIVEWLKVMQDDTYKMIIVDAIKFYQMNERLVLYAYCIMPNHVHLIAQSNGKEVLSAVMRDLKKYTSRTIANKLESENSKESKEVLKIFEEAGKRLQRIRKYKVWQDGNRPVVLYSNKFIWQKLEYIHNNPVEYGLTANPEDYFFCSTRNYADMKSVLNVEILTRKINML